MKRKLIKVPLAVPMDVENRTVGAIYLRNPTRSDVMKIVRADGRDPFFYAIFALSLLSKIDAETLQNLAAEDFTRLIGIVENLVRKKAGARNNKKDV